MFQLSPDLLIMAGAATAGLVIVFAIGALLRPRHSLAKRAAGLSKRGKAAGTTQAAKPGSLRKDGDGAASALDGFARKSMPRMDKLQARFDRTGRQLKPGTYGLVCLGLAVLTFILVSVFGGFSEIIGLLLGLVSGVGLPYWVIGKMGDRRINAFTSQFPDAIDLMVRGLKSGLPVSQSIKSVGEEMPAPVGAEFKAVSDAVSFGQELEDALWQSAKRLDTAEFKFFVISLTVQKETGGNLAETLANLSDILRKRKQMRLKVKAMSSEARASAMLLGMLPFLMFGILYAMSPDYAGQLLSDSRGRLMLIGAGVLMAGGAFVMARLIKFEV
ncbi:MAG: type II secretion system F family protein [Magnetovibrionaceae bacterium]